MLCKILIINMLDYKFKRFIFNVKLKSRPRENALFISGFGPKGKYTILVRVGLTD